MCQTVSEWHKNWIHLIFAASQSMPIFACIEMDMTYCQCGLTRLAVYGIFVIIAFS